MGFFGGGTTTTTTQQNQTNQFQPDPTLMKEWQGVIGTAGGLTDWMVNNAPPQAGVAPPTDLTSQWWQNAGNQNVTGPPEMSGIMGGFADVYNNMSAMGQDPSQINLPSNFNFAPGGINFNNPYSSGVPQMQGPANINQDWSSYLVSPDKVSASQVNARDVNAPAPVDPIQLQNLLKVSAPQLENYQFNERFLQNVNAPNLQNFQMQAAPSVAPSGLATTQNWTDPGTAQQYMSPYTQNVVDVQTQKAIQDWQQATEGQRAQAAASGAYGGSRQAVEEATGQRDLQLQLAQIQATGLQNAYQQGAQQFNTQQALGQQAQQFNIQSAMQAALANQQAQQQANVQNLSSFLQTQGLGAQTGLQAAMANQGANLSVGGQNLQALLQTQGLGAGLGMQAQLANQQQGLQTALANQQAQEFGRQQQMQASLANQQTNLQGQLANQQTGLQAALANQQTGLQAGLAAKQLGMQGALANQQTGLQTGIVNQQALMQALAQQYQGGLAGAMQTQQLGMQGQIAGGQLGLQGAQAQEALRQAQQGINLSAAGQAAGVLNQMGGMNLAGYQAGLMGLSAQQQAALSQQGMAQQQQDVATANAWQNLMTPLQAQAYMASILGQQPVPYTTTGQMTGTQQVTAPPPSIFGQLLGGLLTAAGGAGALGWKPLQSKTGGLVNTAHKARGGRVHGDAAADRAQVLEILREKGLTRAHGGLASVM
jgi:hypothetical protein